MVSVGAVGSPGGLALPNFPVLEERAPELDKVQDLIEHESVGSSWMFGREIVYREAMNDGREDVCLYRR
jgi:hypothetical protein